MAPGVVESFPPHDARDDARWRIVTVWESREAPEAMRASGRASLGVGLSRDAGAAPAPTVLEDAHAS